ncbi:hypothetical protein BDZ97DRAFT_1770127 [Flammula alnicola]|nr:hypothetical protein BDZ97DRAFT_1770127 [Flammula alnicola]
MTLMGKTVHHSQDLGSWSVTNIGNTPKRSWVMPSDETTAMAQRDDCASRPVSKFMYPTIPAAAKTTMHEIYGDHNKNVAGWVFGGSGHQLATVPAIVARSARLLEFRCPYALSAAPTDAYGQPERLCSLPCLPQMQRLQHLFGCIKQNF